MLATSVFLFFSYLISRTRFYRVAIVLAITIPAIAPLAIVIFKPPEVNLTAELMWLALPLLISSLMLSIRKTIIVAVSYITSIIIFAFLGSLGFETIAPLMAYMLTSAFFVITITDVREKNQLEIENQLKERKRMNQSLQESEANISKAFRAIPEAVSIATLKGGVFLEVNDSFMSLNGYSREDVIGHTAKELNIWVNPNDRYRTKQLMEKHGHFENEEFLLRRKSGETHNVLLSADVINYGGKPCILTIGNDITERKQAEEKLKTRIGWP